MTKMKRTGWAITGQNDLLRRHSFSVTKHAICAALLLCAGLLRAQDTAQPAAAPAQPANPNPRAFGVFPNYRLVDSNDPAPPISARHKLTIAAKDSFDWPIFPTAAVFSLFYQAANQNPTYGQGMEGYGKRLAGALADQTIGNLMTEGVMPALLHEDPRYFRMGPNGGSFRHRLWYSATRVFVNRTDSGRNSFNFAEILGNSTEAAISAAWNPDSRTAGGAAQHMIIQVGSDALSNVLKEFWPDVKRKLSHKKETAILQASPGISSLSQ